MEYSLTKQQLTQLKAKLTRAQHRKNSEEVMEACAQAFELFETHGYPDCWSRWQQAYDACYHARGYGINPFSR